MASLRTHSGFTLVELLLVVALISLAAAATVALDRGFAGGRTVQAGGEATVGALRQAQARSAAMAKDDAWSVRIASESATVFKGTDFDARDEGEDRVTAFAGPVTVDGTTDVLFIKGSMIPTAPASTSLEADGRRWVVRVNSEGLVSHASR